MKLTAFVLLLLLWGFEKVAVAAAPARFTLSNASTSVAIKPAITQSFPFVAKKPSLLQKLEWKLIQKKLKKHGLPFPAEGSGSGRVVSTIALICGILAIVVLFIPSIGGVSLLFALGAVIAGIVGVSGKNRLRSAKTKSIIAIVLGGLFLLGVLVFIAAWGGLFSSVE